MSCLSRACLGSLLVCGLLPAQSTWQRYALLLDDPPLAESIASAKELSRPAAVSRQTLLLQKQDVLRSRVEAAGYKVSSSITALSNIVFVQAPPDKEAELAALPGVRQVQPVRPLRMRLNRALDVVRARTAWNLLGGPAQSGNGIRIGILDSGIDQTHPAFQDSSLRVPSGFPLCSTGHCSFTNNKVIVARSYVSLMVHGDQPAFSRPDDLTPRDRVGHGTAMASIAAGVPVTATPLSGGIAGVAPKAYLGNYKIMGSPGVNDLSFEDVMATALEDAFRDGMDVVTVAFGLGALFGPSQTNCGANGTTACDFGATVVENAVRRGMLVITPAGNDGDSGVGGPALSSINTPGTSPSSLTVGAVTNSHALFQSLRVTQSGAPTTLARVNGYFGNGPVPGSALSGSLRDVAKLQNNGRACAALPDGSLQGAIALIERGDCDRLTKVTYAQRAGALAVVLFNSNQSDFLFAPQDLGYTGIPLFFIGSTAGASLRTYLNSQTDPLVSLDPAWTELDAPEADLADFSSLGPTVVDGYLKPELVAVGTDLYVATQNYDPNGAMYSADRYIAVQGTSFAAAMAAGAAALVKQTALGYTPGRLKSALVNTARDVVSQFNTSGQRVPARVEGGGNGLLNVAAALQSNVTVDPAVLSLGIASNALQQVRSLQITNTGSANVTLQMGVLPFQDRGTPSLQAPFVLTSSSVTLPAGSSALVPVTPLTTTVVPGSYQGVIVIEGGNVPLRVPYLYVVSDQTPYNLLPISGSTFTGVVSQLVPSDARAGRLRVRVVDRYGAGVANATLRWTVESGGGSLGGQTTSSNAWGLGGTEGTRLGAAAGQQQFSVSNGSLKVYYTGRGQARPAAERSGVVNAASQRVEDAYAPGSFLTIYGQNLTDGSRSAGTVPLPVSLVGVSVSFDVPTASLSLPARLLYASPGQVNVQIPWELAGHASAQMKVSYGEASTALITLPLSSMGPALFEYTAGGTAFAAALDENNATIGTGNPAVRGRMITLYANGLGPVTNRPGTGEASPTETPALTENTPTVQIGGKNADVQFSGLSPQSVGLYQINVVVPPDAPTGVQPVQVTVGGVAAKATNIVVQ